MQSNWFLLNPSNDIEEKKSDKFLWWCSLILSHRKPKTSVLHIISIKTDCMHSSRTFSTKRLLGANGIHLKSRLMEISNQKFNNLKLNFLSKKTWTKSIKSFSRVYIVKSRITLWSRILLLRTKTIEIENSLKLNVLVDFLSYLYPRLLLYTPLGTQHAQEKLLARFEWNGKMNREREEERNKIHCACYLFMYWS